MALYEAPLYWAGRLWGHVQIKPGTPAYGYLRAIIDNPADIPFPSPMVTSNSALYIVRTTDFIIEEVVEHGGWLRYKVLVADESLGPGDIEAIELKRLPRFLDAIMMGRYDLMPRAPKGLPRNRHGRPVHYNEDEEELRLMKAQR